MLSYRSYTEHPISSIPECKSPRYGTHSSISWPEAMAISPALLGVHPIPGTPGTIWRQSPLYHGGPFCPHKKQPFVALTDAGSQTTVLPRDPTKFKRGALCSLRSYKTKKKKKLKENKSTLIDHWPLANLVTRIGHSITEFHGLLICKIWVMVMPLHVKVPYTLGSNLQLWGMTEWSLGHFPIFGIF